MTPRFPEDAAIVEDNETLYRRLADSGRDFVSRDSITGEWLRPSSGAFKPDNDGVSVYRQAILEMNGLTADDCATTHRHVVVGFLAGEVRAVEPLDVIPDAWPSDVDDPGHTMNAAHALIIGWGGLKSKKVRLRAQRALSRLASMSWSHLPANP
jgi:hypothetical protein